jgi:tRNA-specific 2-thiouridylase
VTQKRIAVALSGGVDSATAAALLVAQGYAVIGVTMRLWREPPDPCLGEPAPLCDLIERARAVADALRIPHHVVDASLHFKERVVDRFIAEYSAGRTPNPCLYCNRHLKFGLLLAQAFDLGAERLATGHYARVRLSADGQTFQLLKGIDERKDQSYVLHVLGQAELARLTFPLGSLTKGRVRRLAREQGLPVAQEEESQDLCFVYDKDYRRFLLRYAPQIYAPGPILDTEGHEIGRHRGLASYTIGQRSGIGIAAPQALYVLRLDVERNALIVGPKSALGCDHLIAQDVNWISGQPPDHAISATVKIRYRARPVSATVTSLPGSRARVDLDAPLRDITPGQGVVFYDGDVVLGGGLITR